MVGCCKFGPCRKKRTYEFNNPPYTANKEADVYHSHKQKLTDGDQSAKNGSAYNPAFESGSAADVGFNGAAVVDLDSDCNSVSEAGTHEVRRNSKHKANAEGFKSADLVVGAKGIDRKDSKRSSKSSHSSSSSSSKSSRGSKRSSKHSGVDVVHVQEDRHSETVETAETELGFNEVDTHQIETTIVTTTTTTTITNAEDEENELIEEPEAGAVAYPDDDDDDTSEGIVVVKTQVITETIVAGEVTDVEVKEEEVVLPEDEASSAARRESHSSSSSSSSSSFDAKSYEVRDAEEEHENKEDIYEEKEQASAGEENTSEAGIEEIDNEVNDRAEELFEASYTVTEDVSVNAHGDDEEHEDFGSDNL